MFPKVVEFPNKSTLVDMKVFTFLSGEVSKSFILNTIFLFTISSFATKFIASISTSDIIILPTFVVLSIVSFFNKGEEGEVCPITFIFPILLLFLNSISIPFSISV